MTDLFHNGIQIIGNTQLNNIISADFLLTGGSGIVSAGSWSSLTGADLTGVTLQGVTDNGATTTNEIGIPSVQFDTTQTLTPTSGQLGWNADDETLELGLNGGGVVHKLGETLFFNVKAAEAISKGNVLYASGAVGNSGKIEASKYTANDTIEENRVLGVAAEDISIGDFGFVYFLGSLKGITTDGSDVGETWVNGTILYASATTAGALTSVQPTAPNQDIPIAFVTSAHHNNGTIYIRATQLGYHLGEIHDVYVPSPSDGEVLTWSNANQRWESDAIAETDTLDSVTSRGNTTTNNIVVNGLTATTDPIDAQGDLRAQSNLRFDAYAPVSGHNLLIVGTGGTVFTRDEDYYTTEGWVNSQGYQTAGDVATIIVNDVDKAFVDALNVDADTLDGLDSVQFLRADVADTATGKITINDGNADPLELTRSTQVGIFLNDTSAPRYLGTSGGNLHFGDNLNHGINPQVLTTADYDTYVCHLKTNQNTALAQGSGTEFTVNFNLEEHNDTSTFTHTGGVVTVLKTGWYRIYANMVYDNSTPSERNTIRAYVKINGTEVTSTATYDYDRGSSYGRFSNNKIETLLYLAVNDTVEIANYAYNEDGTVTIESAESEFIVNSESVSTTAGNADTLDGEHGSYYLDWANLTGVPSTFTPSAHTHTTSDITDLSSYTGLDSRYYTEAEVNSLLAGKQDAGTYNTIIGTDTDVNTSGSTIIDSITVTDGVITAMGTRTLSAGDIGASATSHNHTLDSLSNVTITTPSIGSVLAWSGSAWVDTGTLDLNILLNDLADVNAGAPADGQVLTWSNATSKWIPSTVSGGGGGTVTSVAVTGNNGITVSGSPITTSGTFTLGLSNLANSVLANSTVTISNGNGIAGGAAISLGGSTTLFIDTSDNFTWTGDHIFGTGSSLQMLDGREIEFGSRAGGDYTMYFNGLHLYLEAVTGTTDIYFRAGATDMFLFDMGAGDFHADGEIFAASSSVGSDRAYKRDIKNLDYGLAAVLAARPVEYERIATGNKELGFIAQEMQQLMPELVTNGHMNGMLGLQYTNYTAVLTKAIQEQQELIEEMRKEIKELKDGTNTN